MEAGPIRVRTLPGVYGPQTDSWLLAQALGREDLVGARVLDLCTGSGLLAVTAARAGAADVSAVDVSRRAVLTARMNLRRNGVRGAVVRGDLARAVPDGDFDVIVSNPPYVPAVQDALPTRGQARAWDAGRDGRTIVDRICTEAPARLAPGGRLLLVHSHVCGAERTVELLEEQGLDAEVLMRRELAFGPVMLERARFLEDAGFVGVDERREELVVVRAVRPGPPRAGGRRVA
ncbi:HemK2/MTQ2 family protein methyltransferase [Patulibacter sp.]|uniref:HemK2/MTQ2 family protein methyltransferase n=1 Tax=Patulibacter sp. TaxID=1912859 RepID=UPI00351F197F